MVMISAPDAAADFQSVPLADQINVYVKRLTAKGPAQQHAVEYKRCLTRISADCNFERLTDLNRVLLQSGVVQPGGPPPQRWGNRFAL